MCIICRLFFRLSIVTFFFAKVDDIFEMHSDLLQLSFLKILIVVGILPVFGKENWL